MVKLCILILAGYSLCLHGADNEGDPTRDKLRELGRGTNDLLELSSVLQAGQVRNSLGVKETKSVPLICTKEDETQVVTARNELLKLALENLRSRRKDTEEIMHLAEPLESALRTYRRTHRKDDVEGASPRTICLWGEIREIDDQENFRNNVFFQLAKEKLKENSDVQSRRDQLVQLSKDALNANYDEMSLMIMRVATAFDGGGYDEQMSNEVIDDLFEKAAVNELEIGDEFSPRTQKVFEEIRLNKDTRKALLAWLF